MSKLTEENTEQIDDFDEYYGSTPEEQERIYKLQRNPIRYYKWMKKSIKVNIDFYCYREWYNDPRVVEMRCTGKQIDRIHLAKKDVFFRLPHHSVSFGNEKGTNYEIMKVLVKEAIKDMMFVRLLFNDFSGFTFSIDRDDNVDCNFLWVRFDRKEIMLCSKIKLLGQNPDKGKIDRINERWNTIKMFEKFIVFKCDVRLYYGEIDWLIDKFSPMSINKPIDKWSEEELAKIENTLKYIDLKRYIQVARKYDISIKRFSSNNISAFGCDEKIDEIQRTHKEAFVYLSGYVFSFDKQYNYNYTILADVLKSVLISEVYGMEELFGRTEFKFTIDLNDNEEYGYLWIRFDEKEIILCGKSKVPGLME